MPMDRHSLSHLPNFSELKGSGAIEARAAGTLSMLRDVMSQYSAFFERRLTGEELAERIQRVSRPLIGRTFLSAQKQVFEIGEFLGNGARGVVFAATSQDSTRRELALKLTKPFDPSIKDSDRDSFRANFYNETKALTILRAQKNGDAPLLEESALIRAGSEKEVVGATLMSRLRERSLHSVFMEALNSERGIPELAQSLGAMLEAGHRIASCGIEIEDLGITNTFVSTNDPNFVKLFDFGNTSFPRSKQEAVSQSAKHAGFGLYSLIEGADKDARAEGRKASAEFIERIAEPVLDLNDGKCSLQDAAKEIRKIS